MTDGRPLVVVAGVSGVGKTTVGRALAGELGIPFADADDLHPVANIAKMAAGVPLDDDDRRPWLRAVGAALAAAEARGTGLVMACSALKRVYRDEIRADAPATVFVQLTADRATLEPRVEHRPGHFMPASLLDSQLETLEPLGADERGAAVSVDAPIGDVVTTAVSVLRGATP